jgi:hypothetical protein
MMDDQTPAGFGGARSDKAPTGTSMSGGPTTGPMMMSMKKGGKVRKTGPILAHAGERVLSKKQAKRYDKDRASGRR